MSDSNLQFRFLGNGTSRRRSSGRDGGHYPKHGRQLGERKLYVLHRVHFMDQSIAEDKLLEKFEKSEVA